MIESEKIQEMIAEECDAVKKLLLDKNKKYGNSAIYPKRIFSKQNPLEQIKVRMDDKLSRIENFGPEDESEDTISDLIGYLILFKVAQRIYN